MVVRSGSGSIVSALVLQVFVILDGEKKKGNETLTLTVTVPLYSPLNVPFLTSCNHTLLTPNWMELQCMQLAV